WWCGPFAKAARPPARLTPISWDRACCRNRSRGGLLPGARLRRLVLALDRFLCVVLAGVFGRRFFRRGVAALLRPWRRRGSDGIRRARVSARPGKIIGAAGRRRDCVAMVEDLGRIRIGIVLRRMIS